MPFAPVYSTRFLIGTVVTPSTTRTYTVPAGRTAIISDLTIVASSTATASGAGFYVLPTGGGSATYIWSAPTVVGAIITAAHWTGHVVLNAGDQLVATFIGTGPQCFVQASGYLLTN